MVRPNVLLLVQDQLRHDAVVDPALCSTPTMDRLRAEGTWFDRCYTPTALCSPARSTIFTGLYPHGTRVLRNVIGPLAAVEELPLDVPTIAEILREAGYRTGYAGKWHLGGDAADRGFEDTAMTDSDLNTERFRPFWGPFRDHAPSAYFNRTAAGQNVMPVYNDEPVAEEDTPAWEVQDRIRAFLRTYAEADEPFFLAASFFEPHWPYVLPERYLHMYDPASIEPWASFHDDFEGKPATMDRCMRLGGTEATGWDVWSRIVAYYFGSVSWTDHLMGLVVDELDALGLGASTVVIATCDHGDMAGSHRQFNKGAYLYEETYRIPLVVRWPGTVPAGAQHDGFTSLIDVTPTILDATGAAPTGPLHGRSLLPVAAGEAGGRDAVYCQYHGDELGAYDQRMIRQGDWKLIAHRDDPTELYDLAADPAELHNLAEVPEHGATRTMLEARLADLMEEHGDPLGRWPARLGGVPSAVG
jgi:arylsulfatase A-like enzyme